MFSSDIPVLELEKSESGASERISELILEGIRLGRRGLRWVARAWLILHPPLQRKQDIPVVDGVGAAVGLAQTLIRCGVAPSKRGVWAMPARAKTLDRFERPGAIRT
ncbi:hypothetical protein [Mesorhizobium sp. M0213]|uniref:hypothetical protein n=1 Tax=Mesorhizobium sp. M0213 TaxID=2956917 RepID=UPI003334B7F5